MRVNGILDLLQNEIQQAAFHKLATDPTSPAKGQFWYNTTDNVVKYFDGTNIITIATGGDTTTIESSVTALQTEVDAIETAVGLNSDGTFGGFTGANYVSSATDIADAISILDGQAKTTADGLAQEITNRQSADTALQNELDATQTGAGLGANGTYTADTNANYINSATSLYNADQILDTHLKSLADDVAALDLQTVYNNSQIDAQGAAGIKLNTGKDFRIYDDNDSTVYFQVDSETGKVTITGDLEVLGTQTVVESTISDADHWLISPSTGTTTALEINPDTAVNFTVDIVKIKAEHNGADVFRIGPDGKVYFQYGQVSDRLVFNDQTVTGETVAGATPGTYNLKHIQLVPGSVTFTGTVGGNAAVEGTDYTINYAKGTVTLINAFDSNPTIDYTYHPAVDGRNVAADGAKLDAHIAGSDYKHNANVIVYNNTTSGLSATDVQAAIDELATSTGSTAGALQSEVDAIEAAVGLNADGTLNGFTGANYIATSTTYRDALFTLDTQAKTNADGLAQEITDRQTADTAIRNDFASTTAGKGASLVGISDTLTNAPTATQVEAALEGLDDAITAANSDISDLVAALGASDLAGINYSTNNFVTDATSLVQAVSDLDSALYTFQNDLASTTANKGATLVGVSGTFSNSSGTNVEQILEDFDVAISNAGKRYEYVATVAGTTFTITHNLGYKYVNVTVYDQSDDQVIIPNSIKAIDTNTVEITFTADVAPVVKIVA